MPVKEDSFYTNQKGDYKKGGSNKKQNYFGKSKIKSGTNPMDSDGDIMRCHECDSTKHFASSCPHQKVEGTNMNVHITLVWGKADSGTGSMLVESLGNWMLDSTSTKTISGEEWMNEYIENLHEEYKKEVLCQKLGSKSLLRFGDLVESKSIKTVNIPIVIGSKRMLLEVAVVKNNIPLLISKVTMSKLGMKMAWSHGKLSSNKIAV